MNNTYEHTANLLFLFCFVLFFVFCFWFVQAWHLTVDTLRIDASNSLSGFQYDRDVAETLGMTFSVSLFI